MNKIVEAQDILKTLGMPPAQYNELSALIFLALCKIGPNDSWEAAVREPCKVTKDIMKFMADKYDREYAPNSRETVRRQVLHQFVQANVAEYNAFNPNLPTNSPNAHYCISELILEVVKSYGTDDWESMVELFIQEKGSLSELYNKQRIHNMVPVTLPNGEKLQLSPGKHNILEAAIIEEFAPRFAPGAQVLYLGDTAVKDLILDVEKFSELHVPISNHNKLPDVVLYSEEKNWLYLIEAVTSHGPISPKRFVELEKMLRKCEVGKVYFTAFLDFTEYKRHAKEIAWETEVWVAENPDHLIHYNGDRFFGPRN